jgi:hypothetical protein
MIEYKYRKASAFDLTLIVSIPNKDTPYIVRGRLTKIGLPFAIYRGFILIQSREKTAYCQANAIKKPDWDSRRAFGLMFML